MSCTSQLSPWVVLDVNQEEISHGESCDRNTSDPLLALELLDSDVARRRFDPDESVSTTSVRRNSVHFYHLQTNDWTR